MNHDVNTEIHGALRDHGRRLVATIKQQWAPRVGLLRARLLALETTLHLAASATRAVLEMVPEERHAAVLATIEERSRELLDATGKAGSAQVEELRALDA